VTTLHVVLLVRGARTEFSFEVRSALGSRAEEDFAAARAAALAAHPNANILGVY
jgi:hypothetical protein